MSPEQKLSFKNRLNRLSILVVLLACLFYPVSLFARNAPLTTAGSSTVCPGGTVTVPVTVTNFISIKAITLRLDYNPTELVFVDYTNLNAALASGSISNISVSPTLSKIIFFWLDVNALNLPNGTKLFDLNFTLSNGSPLVSFNNSANSGGDCEYADELGAAMTDVPTSSFYFDATITNNAIGAAGPITGANTLCAGASNILYSIPPIPNATGYAWTVPTGATVISGSNTNTITVNYSVSAVSGNISVAGTNTCGMGTSSTLAVTINPLPVPTISGPGNVCVGTSNVNYTTEAGMTNYTWTISSGGAITTGAGTNSVQVTWNQVGAQSVSVTYSLPATGCQASVPTVRSVTVNALPVPTLTGPDLICADPSPHTYITEPGMTGYTWNVSPGGSITAGGGANNNTITITWLAYSVQSVSVNYTNPAGCTGQIPAAITINFNPLPVPTISGPANSCMGASGIAYSTEPGMSGYQWTISPGGTITSGSASSSIQVTWNGSGAQVVGVKYTDLNGCTAGAFTMQNVTVNILPGSAGNVTGPDTVCAGTSGVVYQTAPIAAATSYEWTLPQGASITAGAGTNQITVTFSPNPGTGIISVAGVNECGSGLPSPGFDVVMVISQPAPVVSALGPLLTSSVADGNQWYYEGTGMIPGAILQTYTATITGWYWTVIEGVGCPSLESNHVYVLFTGFEDSGPSDFRIAPNPNDGRFTVSLNSPVKERMTIIICNFLGEVVFSASERMMDPGKGIEVDLQEAGSGVYFILIRMGDITVVKKVLVK